jgi:hypothetical protein
LGLGVLWASGGGCGSEPSKSANPAVQQASAVAPTAPTAPTALPRPAAPAPLPTPGVVPSAAAPQVSELAMVLGSAVNVRPGAGTSFPPRGRIHCGDLVAIRGREGDWLQIQLGELTGYSHSAYLVEVKAGQGSRPTCEFAHRGITAPRRKQPEKLPTTPSASPQVALSKIVAGNAVPEQVAVAAATLPSASRPAGSPAAAPTPPPTPAVKPAAAAGADAQPQLVWLSTHGIKPKVMFPHPHHAQMFACAKCHHPLGSPGPNKDKDCSTCHIAGGKGQSPVSNKDAFHQTCRACHEATGRGPTACQECHSGGK